MWGGVVDDVLVSVVGGRVEIAIPLNIPYTFHNHPITIPSNYHNHPINIP